MLLCPKCKKLFNASQVKIEDGGKIFTECEDFNDEIQTVAAQLMRKVGRDWYLRFLSNI